MSETEEPGTSATTRVGAKVTTMIGQLAIPPLQEGQSIGDWEPVFTASVTPLLIRDDGQKLAVCSLPAYVCRRTAEIELVCKAIKVDTLVDAFNLLKTLDDPVDQYVAYRNFVDTTGYEV